MARVPASKQTRKELQALFAGQNEGAASCREFPRISGLQAPQQSRTSYFSPTERLEFAFVVVEALMMNGGALNHAIRDGFAQLRVHTVVTHDRGGSVRQTP